MWAYHIYVNKMQKEIQLTDPKYRETFCGKVMGLSAYGNIKEFKKDWRTHFEGIPQVALESLPGQDYNYGNLSPALVASVADITAAVIHLKAVLNNTSEADCLSPPQ